MNRRIHFATRSSSISGILLKTHKNVNLIIVTLVIANTIAIKDWFFTITPKVHIQLGKGPHQIRSISRIVNKATPEVYDFRNCKGFKRTKTILSLELTWKNTNEVSCWVTGLKWENVFDLSSLENQTKNIEPATIINEKKDANKFNIKFPLNGSMRITPLVEFIANSRWSYWLMK